MLKLLCDAKCKSEGGALSVVTLDFGTHCVALQFRRDHFSSERFDRLHSYCDAPVANLKPPPKKKTAKKKESNKNSSFVPLINLAYLSAPCVVSIPGAARLHHKPHSSCTVKHLFQVQLPFSHRRLCFQDQSESPSTCPGPALL